MKHTIIRRIVMNYRDLRPHVWSSLLNLAIFELVIFLYTNVS